jgi:hypothetical protein
MGRDLPFHLPLNLNVYYLLMCMSRQSAALNSMVISIRAKGRKSEDKPYNLIFCVLFHN